MEHYFVESPENLFTLRTSKARKFSGLSSRIALKNLGYQKLRHLAFGAYLDFMCQSYILKVKRAEMLSSELRQEVSRLIAQTTIKCDDSTGRAVYSFDESEDFQLLKQNISLLVSDILHNLRSALDYYAFLKYTNNQSSSLKEDKVYFPIFDSDEKFKNKADEIKEIDSSYYDLLEKDIKPYKEGNLPLWRLNKLNNISKHRDMVLVVNKSKGVDIGALVSQRLEGLNPDFNFPEISFFLPADDDLQENPTLLIDEPGSKCVSGYKFKISLNLKEVSLEIDEPLVLIVIDMVDEVKRILNIKK